MVGQQVGLSSQWSTRLYRTCYAVMVSCQRLGNHWSCWVIAWFVLTQQLLANHWFLFPSFVKCWDRTLHQTVQCWAGIQYLTDTDYYYCLLPKMAQKLKITDQARDLLVEESINDSVSVDLGIDHSGAIGNNEPVVAVQRGRYFRKPC